MRLFAALELPRGTVAQVTEWQKPLVSRYPSLKWVSGNNMHLTLRFFGDIGQDTQERVIRILGAWVPGPLEFCFHRLGSFGRKGSPSVYWLGGDFPGEVMEIARQLGSIPDERGRVSERGYLPHLTVARRRDGLVPMLEPPGPISGMITGAAVINSRLTSKGPEYEYIQTFDLH